MPCNMLTVDKLTGFPTTNSGVFMQLLRSMLERPPPEMQLVSRSLFDQDLQLTLSGF